jgi:predicted transcriptional regulator
MIAHGMATVDMDREMGRYGEVLEQSVSELMTPNPVAVDPEMHLLRAATVMVRHDFRRIPVAEEGKLLGMLTLGDDHKAIFHANMTGRLNPTSGPLPLTSDLLERLENRLDSWTVLSLE